MRHFGHLSLLLLAAAPLVFGGSVGETAPLPPAAVKMLDLFDRLRGAQNNPADGDHHVAFKLTEPEINEYLRYALKTTPRPGVDSVTIKVFPKDYISTYTKVDFDALDKWQPGIIPTVLRPVLKGKKAVWIDCRIHAEGGNLTFKVEKARYDNIPLPAVFVEKMIQVVAAQQPEKYDTSNPVPLPFGVTKLSTGEHFLQGHN